MEKFRFSYFGCVAIIKDIPTLFIKSNGILLEGIPLIINDDNLYVYLNNNEMVVVGIKIEDEYKIEIDADDLTDDNLDQYDYKISPFSVYKLKTEGLTFDDILELNIMYMIFNKAINQIFNE